MKKGLHHVSLYFITSMLVATLAGCATSQNTNSETNEYEGLTISEEVNFSDVPVPSGFTFLRNESYVYKDGDARIALLRYKGSEKINPASIFFQTQMSRYQWREVKLIDYKQNIQQYMKGNELCIVTIERINTPFLFIPIEKTLITIQLTPLPANQAYSAQSTTQSTVPMSAAPVQTQPVQQRTEQQYEQQRQRYPMSTLK